MSVAMAVQQARTECGLSQEYLGIIGKCSRQTIQAAEKGRRNLPEQAQRVIARELNDYRVYFELIYAATGVKFAPWLDGLNNNPLAATMLFHQWLQRVQDAIVNKIFPLIVKKRDVKAMSAGEKEEIEEALLDFCDVITAGENAVARLAKEYGINLADLWDKHAERLAAQELLTKKQRRGKRL